MSRSRLRNCLTTSVKCERKGTESGRNGGRSLTLIYYCCLVEKSLMPELKLSYIMYIAIGVIGD